MKKRNKIAFGSATPVFADDERTITEYIFHIRFDNKKRRMSFRYHVATKSIISYTPIERKLTAEQCEIIRDYFNCFVGKRKAKDAVHAKPQQKPTTANKYTKEILNSRGEDVISKT